MFGLLADQRNTKITLYSDIELNGSFAKSYKMARTLNENTLSLLEEKCKVLHKPKMIE